MGLEDKLAVLDVELPESIYPAGNYVPAVCAGQLIFTSGQVPRVEGKLKYKGKLGRDLELEDGYQAARLCILNCLAIIRQTVGSLSQICRVVKMTGYVNSTPDFEGQTQVMDGATDLLREVFGESGIPARSAVGVASLPDGSPCEVELIVQLKDM